MTKKATTEARPKPARRSHKSSELPVVQREFAHKPTLADVQELLNMLALPGIGLELAETQTETGWLVEIKRRRCSQCGGYYGADVPSPPVTITVVQPASVIEEPQEQTASYTANDAARAYFAKKANQVGNGAAAADGKLRWANGKEVSLEDQGLS